MFPLDLVKTRLQNQKVVTYTDCRYWYCSGINFLSNSYYLLSFTVIVTSVDFSEYSLFRDDFIRGTVPGGKCHTAEYSRRPQMPFQSTV